jgi:hypothetical protein
MALATAARRRIHGRTVDVARTKANTAVASKTTAAAIAVIGPMAESFKGILLTGI